MLQKREGEIVAADQTKLFRNTNSPLCVEIREILEILHLAQQLNILKVIVELDSATAIPMIRGDIEAINEDGTWIQDKKVLAHMNSLFTLL